MIFLAQLIVVSVAASADSCIGLLSPPAAAAAESVTIAALLVQGLRCAPADATRLPLTTCGRRNNNNDGSGLLAQLIVLSVDTSVDSFIGLLTTGRCGRCGDGCCCLRRRWW